VKYRQIVPSESDWMFSAISVEVSFISAKDVEAVVELVIPLLEDVDVTEEVVDVADEDEVVDAYEDVDEVDDEDVDEVDDEDVDEVEADVVVVSDVARVEVVVLEVVVDVVVVVVLVDVEAVVDAEAVMCDILNHFCNK
jgi:hypothetical protein